MELLPKEDSEMTFINWLGKSMVEIKLLREDALKLLKEVRELKIGLREALFMRKIPKAEKMLSELQGRYIKSDTNVWKPEIKHSTKEEEQEFMKLYPINVGGLYRELDGCLSVIKYVGDALSGKRNRTDFLRGLVLSMIAVLISASSFLLRVFGIF